MQPNQYDIELAGLGFYADFANYSEQGASGIIPRQMYQTATGELDFENGWPYHQRSWILGEHQQHTHEFDEMKSTAPRRYQEGHGVNNEVEGELKLLPELEVSQAATVSTCPMCVSKDGSAVFAYPVGSNAYKYTSGSWAGETHGGTSPILDCVNAGDDIYIVDSSTDGSRVRKRSSAGTYAQITAPTTETTDGNTTEGDVYQECASNNRYLTKMRVAEPCSIRKLHLYLDGSGSGSGSQVCKGVIYSEQAGKPYQLLGTSSEVTVLDGQSPGWVAFTLATPISISAECYLWVGLICGANSNTIRYYRLALDAADLEFSAVADTYADGPAATSSGDTLSAFRGSAYITYDVQVFASDAYNNATAVAWTNGELYILTPTKLYAHDAQEVACEWTGGSIMASHAGSIFFSDGSNRVYMYNGIGTRLMMEDLPTGYQVQCLFSAHGRLWICGKLPNGDAAIYWYSNGQWGVLDFLPADASSTRSIKAGAATAEYALFADSRYGGMIRHYVPEGGWAHYLAYGAACTIPYKGMAVGAGSIFVALDTPVGGTDGIYKMGSTYVPEGSLTTSQMDLQMPAHNKEWTSVEVFFLPLRAGETISLDYSLDGGRTWISLETVDQTGATSHLWRTRGLGPTMQFRLNLASPIDKSTTPTIISTTARANPVMRAGREWSIVLIPRATSATGGIDDQGFNERAAKLIEIAQSGKPITYKDPFGGTYNVAVRPYQRIPFGDNRPGRRSSMLKLTLQEVPS